MVDFLTYLAVERHVSEATQRQARCALLFLYRTVMGRELDGLEASVRAQSSRRVPVVMSVEEVRAVLGALGGTHYLIATLLYGGGLRLLECLRLRVKDIDFARSQLCVRQGKGRKDRFTTLPDSIRPAMSLHLAQVRALHQRDLKNGHGRAPLPHALDRKLPSARASRSESPLTPSDTPSRLTCSKPESTSETFRSC